MKSRGPSLDYCCTELGTGKVPDIILLNLTREICYLKIFLSSLVFYRQCHMSVI